MKPSSIRAVRLGQGANCSSVGSVVDTLFLCAAGSGAVFAAVCAAMATEPVRIVREIPERRPSNDGAEPDEARE